MSCRARAARSTCHGQKLHGHTNGHFQQCIVQAIFSCGVVEVHQGGEGEAAAEPRAMFVSIACMHPCTLRIWDTPTHARCSMRVCVHPACIRAFMNMHACMHACHTSRCKKYAAVVLRVRHKSCCSIQCLQVCSDASGAVCCKGAVSST